MGYPKMAGFLMDNPIRMIWECIMSWTKKRAQVRDDAGYVANHAKSVNVYPCSTCSG